MDSILDTLANRFETNPVGEIIPRDALSPMTRAMVARYFDGQIDEAKRYADHLSHTCTHNPAWVRELAESTDNTLAN